VCIPEVVFGGREVKRNRMRFTQFKLQTLFSGDLDIVATEAVESFVACGHNALELLLQGV